MGLGSCSFIRGGSQKQEPAAPVLPGCHGGCGYVLLGPVPLLSCPCVKQRFMGSLLLLLVVGLGWAGLLSRCRTETGQILTGRPCRHGETGWGLLAGGCRLMDSVSLGALGASRPPRRLRGSRHTQLGCPERGLAAVGEAPLCCAASPLRLLGLPLPVVRGLQQLQHPPHL